MGQAQRDVKKMEHRCIGGLAAVMMIPVDTVLQRMERVQGPHIGQNFRVALPRDRNPGIKICGLGFSSNVNTRKWRQKHATPGLRQLPTHLSTSPARERSDGEISCQYFSFRRWENGGAVAESSWLSHHLSSKILILYLTYDLGDLKVWDTMMVGDNKKVKPHIQVT